MIELDVEVPLASFALQIRANIDGRAIAIVGPSGGGKSTLLETIAGVRTPRRAKIVIDGVELSSLPPEERRVGWVPQEVALFPHLDVAANIAFGARQKVDEAIALLELEPLLTRDVETLSGGERQRVALARALATDPRLLLLDEPLAAVDVAHRGRIVPFLLRLHARVPLLLVTHDLGEAAAIASHALVLRAGRVHALGPIASAIGAAFAAVPDLRVDNLLRGAVAEGTLTLESGGTLSVPRGDPSGAASYALPAEEIMIAVERPVAISARNVIPATVRAIDVIGDDALVEVEALGQHLRAKLTDAAVESLALAPEQRVFLVIKSHALRRV